MAEKRSPETKKFSADWFMRGALARIGDSFDKLTGRDWSPSSSLTASELIERIKKLLDAEAVEVPGKGTVVPHEIRLKMQWDKFSDDADDALKNLEHELLAAAIDHINDSLYYTYAPVTLEVKPDYFIEGVKLYVGFGKFGPEEEDVELNVTVAGININDALQSQPKAGTGWQETVVLRYTIKGTDQEKQLEFSPGGRRSVGRAASSDLVLDNDSVSKMHASLSIGDDGVLSVADTGSTNGTFINGQRIAYGKAVALVDGDVLKFGQVEVRFERLPRTEPVAASPPVEEKPAGDVVEIDGFEFKRRSAPDIPLTKTVEEPVINTASTEQTSDGPADTE
jgi:pSer/pThr/pTyr-binding forkhead associated (FHA) protein